METSLAVANEEKPLYPLRRPFSLQGRKPPVQQKRLQWIRYEDMKAEPHLSGACGRRFHTSIMSSVRNRSPFFANNDSGGGSIGLSRTAEPSGACPMARRNICALNGLLSSK